MICVKRYFNLVCLSQPAFTGTLDFTAPFTTVQLNVNAVAPGLVLLVGNTADASRSVSFFVLPETQAPNAPQSSPQIEYGDACQPFATYLPAFRSPLFPLGADFSLWMAPPPMNHTASSVYACTDGQVTGIGNVISF